eukprot:TRINITY_DN6560_c0_g1_i2.p1 TRINITY_DN6560_c0_g1~~TRINITY_DN6560_c0_g1_i2.p1  ORF type:complete len:399 (+),score=131.38 TRINITY_DN6560_c0_g1_i2:236-1432(+)
MATYIGVIAPEEQILNLCKLIASKSSESKIVETNTPLIDQKNLTPVWNNLLDESKALFSGPSSEDVEGFYAAFMSLLVYLTPNDVNGLIPKIVQSITSNPDDNPSLKLKILGNTYNILQNPSERFQLFNAIVNFCIAARNPKILIPQFQDIDQKIKEWGIDAEATRNLFKKIRDVFKQSQKSEEAHKWTVKYLSTLNQSTSEEIKEAAEAALDAIRLPDLYQFDSLLSLKSVQQLENDSTHSGLYKLLKIFVNDNIHAYNALLASHSGIIKQLGLNEEETSKKIRILSLTSIGAANHELTFDAIAKELDISTSEVEMWVITAMAEGVLDAKINQIKQTVRITRSIQRVFTMDQWKNLNENLNSWKTNINVLLSTLQDCKNQSQQQARELLKTADATQI